MILTVKYIMEAMWDSPLSVTVVCPLLNIIKLYNSDRHTSALDEELAAMVTQGFDHNSFR